MSMRRLNLIALRNVLEESLLLFRGAMKPPKQ